MADNIIQAVEILVDKLMTSRPELGLYSVSGGNAELRWTEAPLTGTTKAYAENILLKNGIGEIKESGNFENGGSPVQINNVTISIKNTNQFLLRLKKLSIHLSGLKLLIREFIGTDADSDATSGDVVFTGTIEDVSETIGELKIIAKSSFAYKRNRNIATVLNQDAIAPITYGSFNPTLDSNGNITSGAFAKCINSINSETILRNIDLMNLNPEDVTPVASIFPISRVYNDEADYNPLKFRAFLCAAGVANFTQITDMTNLYVRVVRGKGSGQVRKVTSLENPQTDEIIFTIRDYLETELSNEDSSQDGRSWVEFFRIRQEYAFDDKSSVGPIDENGNSIINPMIYAYDKKYTFLNQFGYSAFLGESNILKIDSGISSQVGKLDTFQLIPVKNVRLYGSDAIDKISYYGYEGYTKLADGIYYKGPFQYVGVRDMSPDVWDSSLITDRNPDTRAAIGFDYSYYYSALKPNSVMAIGFNLPDIPDGIDFDNIYVLVKMESMCDPAGSEIAARLHWRGLMYNGNQFFEIGEHYLDKKPDNPPYAYGVIDCIPDFYYSPETSTGNKNFLVETVYENEALRKIYGYQNFEITGISKGNIGLVYEFVLSLYRKITPNPPGVLNGFHNLRIYEIALCLKKAVSIESQMFSRWSGRKFPSTWGGRKTADNLIESPVDILEHVKREQNWSDNSGTALIKTSGDGSFDDSSLAEVKALTPARQIFDYDKATTEALTKSICESFWLCSRQDNNGYECVDYLLRDEDPSETITYADLIDGAAEITDPRPQNIYCEPVINYCYDYGAEKFTKQLRITNSNQVDYDASYASGFEGSDGQEIWENCHILNAKYRQVEKMPSHLTDLHWVYTYADAVWVLRKRIEWMQKKRASFKVGYTKGRLYYVGKHIMLQLPHETNSVAVECVIEAVTKNKAGNRVSVSIVILDEIPSDFYFTRYQDTDGAETLWQDTDGATTKYQDGDA